MVRAFAASPAFRAATAEELVNEHNPFRRPVRPDDLAWLDFSVPLVPERALMLSGLLGHRMLRNVYEADTVYVPERPTPAAASDRGYFYSAENRAREALAAPVLEQHLFAAALPGVRARVLDEYRGWVARTSQYGRLFAEAGLSADPLAYWQFFLVSSLGRANHMHFLARYPEKSGEFLLLAGE